MSSLLDTGQGVHYKSLKTVNQSLKHKVNRCVFSLRLNECKLSASRSAAGRLFHTTGPATHREGSIAKFRWHQWHRLRFSTSNDLQHAFQLQHNSKRSKYNMTVNRCHQVLWAKYAIFGSQELFNSYSDL